MRILQCAVFGWLVAAVGCTSSAPQAAKTATAQEESTARSTAPATADNAEDPATTAGDETQTSSTPAAEPKAVAADREASAPIVRRAAKPVVGDAEAGVPPVLLSAGHTKLCRVNVGDMLPTIELPRLNGGAATLESLSGARSTVVVFWTNDHWMSAMALRDLARIATPDDVSIVGIAVNIPADAAQKRLADAGAKFPQLVDAEGTAFAQVGELALPRVYVLNAERRIAWFDIEYSQATYRELHQTLAALTVSQ
jgi:peroxiredoxin